MAGTNFGALVNTRSVDMLRKTRSIMLSHDVDVGVKCVLKRHWRVSSTMKTNFVLDASGAVPLRSKTGTIQLALLLPGTKAGTK